VTKPHPTVAGDGQAILPIDSEQGKANSWHTDVTFIDRIPSASILRAVLLPPYGGTTTWANTAYAYETLHPALKALVDRLWAVHSNLYDYVAERDEKRIGGVDVKQRAYRAEFANQEFVTEHPVVRVHPIIAVWDNRATQHHAVDDWPRRLHTSRSPGTSRSAWTACRAPRARATPNTSHRSSSDRPVG
jgi:alpha-ketoglutarate-dependent taurine dioxygenase